MAIINSATLLQRLGRRVGPKAGGLQARCLQGFAAYGHGFALGALALKPSGFCSIKVPLTDGVELA